MPPPFDAAASNDLSLAITHVPNMNPRSPPARPHIGINLSHFSTNAEWGEDDAWDSASDSESPRHSTLTTSWNRPSASSSTAPKAVPRRPSNASSSTLAFSYTHLQAPSSYPPKQELGSGEPPKNGWTIVRTSNSGQGSQNKRDEGMAQKSAEFEGDSGDMDVEGDMILGDLEPETNSTKPSAVGSPRNSKSNPAATTFRPDVDDIVNGNYIPITYFHSSSGRLGSRSAEWHTKSESAQGALSGACQKFQH